MAKLDLSKYADFVPAPEFFESLPETAGNELNGLGEPDIRPPDPILWHADTSTSPFGDLQKWYQKSVGLSVGAKSHRMANVEFRKNHFLRLLKRVPIGQLKSGQQILKKRQLKNVKQMRSVLFE